MSLDLVRALMQPGATPAESLLEHLSGLRPGWMRDAACLEAAGIAFFPGPASVAADARAVCGRCLVREECLAYALDDESLYGIWGGTSARERRQLRRARSAA